jgi:hypothetical protein
MNPTRFLLPGSPGDPASHLQFQISLLRLMDQKWAGHKASDWQAGAKVGPAIPSAQVIELERLQHPRRTPVRLKTRS